MGVFRGAMMGDLRGRVGNTVAAMLKGQNVLRQLPTPSSKPHTVAQLTQQLKFKLATSFLKPIKSIITLGYQEIKGTSSGYNVAMQSILDNGVTGLYPDFVLDYPAINLSLESQLDSADAVSVTSAAGGQVTINWLMNDYPSEGSSGLDLATMVFYNPAKRKYVSVHKGPARSKLTFTFKMPSLHTGDSLYGWMYFSTPDGKRVSSTDYLGKVVVLA